MCTPNPTKVDAAGDWLNAIAPGAVQLSMAVTPPKTSGTTAWQFASALAPGTAGQFTVGAVVSSTVTTAVQVWLLPWMSVTVKVTVFVPILLQSKLVLLRL